jgi:hypothetical protein
MTTYDDVITAVRELAAEKPDFVYTPDAGACLYVHPNSDGTISPGCLIGQAFQRVGVPNEVLLRYNDRNIELVANAGEITDVANIKIGWLTRIQWYQDNSKTWAYAVQQADTWLESLQ